MNKDDVLIIGNGLTNGHEDWTKEYKDPIINKWLIQIPQQLGLNENDVEYDVRFVNSRIEEIYIVKTDKTINHLGKTVNFKRGDRIVVAISYKYIKPEFQKILSKFFSFVKVYTDKENIYALAVCKK